MSRGKEKPAILFRKDKRGLTPVSAFDEEALSALPLGTEFELKAMTKRSWPQLKLYWSILAAVVAATGIAPDAPHLHSLIKQDLGYVTLVKLLDGTLQSWPDSAALDAMEPDEFSQFFDSAMKRLAEVTGIDPMAILEEQRAA